MLECDNRYYILTDAQCGFLQGLSTLVAIFILQSLVRKTQYNINRI